ncbi:MAG TPA: TonB-dependent receptor plug domain-containing protein [Longimicrobiales bacterium]|nr:TonB-dependent receptor plug domain-containing protein [Longimicrobiales bacterium]
MMRRIPYLVLLALFVGACASSGSPRSLSSRNVITQQEIESVNVSTAYEVVQQLRPHFLQGRGQTSIQDPGSSMPVVYVNGVRYGSPDVLRGMRSMDLREIRFLSASDATTRYGTGHVGGVIEVTTRGT